MPKYIIPVTYMMYGKYEIEADNILEAMGQASAQCLPSNAEYMDDSFDICVKDIEENNNLNEADKKLFYYT